ncbi:HSF_DOMAIN domain-containing protein [Psidium guajava]|nr:HSF_DOMAIN domain-containing protein [Psidium guajava]
MDASPQAGGGGGPAPFLLKTYEMVDDAATDEIVAWSPTKSSFIVWNPPEFARVLLPTYFKHNNFSSFIRQLNTYGFRKIDPERWEFANEDFVKDKKHLLKNIHRRKPIHSHSQPQGSMVDPERAAYEEELDKLNRDKSALEAKIVRLKKQQSIGKLHMEELIQRVGEMEHRQEDLLGSLGKALQNPNFVEHLTRKIESLDLSAYNKKRRLPQTDHARPVAENSVDTHSSSRPELGNIFQQDFSNKLRLELSPTVSDINLVSNSTQSSHEDGGSPRRITSENDPSDALMRTESILCAPEALELSDTGTSFTFKMDSSVQRKPPVDESPRMHSLPMSLTTEEGDSNVSCQLNLTLASSLLQVDHSQQFNRSNALGPEISKSPDARSNASIIEYGFGAFQKNRNLDEERTNSSSLPEARNNNQVTAPALGRVNDVFWEQFLTERPGSSETEEASSSYRENSCNVDDDRKPGPGLSRNSKSMERLAL